MQNLARHGLLYAIAARRGHYRLLIAVAQRSQRYSSAPPTLVRCRSVVAKESQDSLHSTISFDRGCCRMLDPRQEELYRAWCREAEARPGVPPRAAFDPVDFPCALSTLALYEFVESDAVLLRVVGTDIVRAWGVDNTGRLLHEIMDGDYHTFIRGHLDQCARERVPLFSHSRFQWDRGRALDTRRLLLPYTRNDKPKEVGFVLLSQIFDYGKCGPPVPLVSIGGGFRIFEVERRALSPSGKNDSF